MVIQSYSPSFQRLQAPKGPEPAPAEGGKPPEDQVEVQPQEPTPPPEPPSQRGWVYRSARFVTGSVGAMIGGAIGTAVGGVLHAGDTVIPEKVQKLASRVLRPGLALVGAGLGLYAGMTMPLLGPARLAMLGAVGGAVIGGGLPGGLDALLASGKGAVCEGWKGKRKGFELAAGGFDKAMSYLQGPPQPPAPPAPPSA